MAFHSKNLKVLQDFWPCLFHPHTTQNFGIADSYKGFCLGFQKTVSSFRRIKKMMINPSSNWWKQNTSFGKHEHVLSSWITYTMPYNFVLEVRSSGKGFCKSKDQLTVRSTMRESVHHISQFMVCFSWGKAAIVAVDVQQIIWITSECACGSGDSIYI